MIQAFRHVNLEVRSSSFSAFGFVLIGCVDFVTEDVPLLETAMALPDRLESPSLHASSVTVGGSQESNAGRLRISREEVQRRLMGKRGEDPEGSEGDTQKERERQMRKDEHAEKDRTAESMSDASAEGATIETVEKRVGMKQERPVTVHRSLAPPGPSLNFDFGSRFGRGLDLNMGGDLASETGARIEVSQLDVDVDMRSALDRLMDDVAGNSSMGQRQPLETPDDSMETSHEASMIVERAEDAELEPFPRPVERAATDSALLPGHGIVSPVSRNTSVSSIPPTPPPKDAIRTREELVLEKRREARQREESESLGYYTPPKHGLPRRVPGNMLAVANERPRRRRSRSTGDLEELNNAAKRRGVMTGDGNGLLDLATFAEVDDPLADSIDRELKKLENPRKSVSFDHFRYRRNVLIFH